MPLGGRFAQPALVTFTNPDDGPATCQIGVGVLASICPGTGFDLDGLIDYQRNTGVGKEQDSLKDGVTGYWRPVDLVVRGNSPRISFRTNFKNDGVKDSRGWQNGVGHTHLFAGSHALALPNLPFRFGRPSGNRLAALEVIYFPCAGLEFHTVLDAPIEEATGTTTGRVLQLNLGFYPAPLKDRSPVGMTIGFTCRADLKDTTNQTDHSHPLFTLEATSFTIQNEKMGEIGFGVSYTNGEDPDESFESQAFWQLTMNFRLKKT